MEEAKRPKNFIEEFIEEDMRTKEARVQTRFPPEPNGYLHIGHAKALCIDFGMAEKYGGVCNLRYDDTNPTKEDVEYVDAIQADIQWLGFQWNQVLFGSSYFDQCYDLAVRLIQKGVAYVDDLSKEEMRAYRGTLTEPGKNSPYRERSVEENLALFARMRAGEFPDGAKTLRAKIDMGSPNINMRDPALYRIKHVRHHQTGDKWCIYPMYDFAHPIQDAIEGVTHSLCSLEYEAHRPLYNWVVDECEFTHKPRQIEFARLNITDTIMSKRYLRRLVEEGFVSGWDDPRMPTLCAMRRRGYPPEAIRDFLDRVGVAKADSVVDAAMLEHCVREQLNASAPRRMAVLDPVLLEIDNWEEGRFEEIELENHPNDPALGNRTVRFGKRVYIERSDFAENPPKKFFRLKPEGEVRLKGAYIVKCTGWEANDDGTITKIHCTFDPDSKSGECARKVKGTLHWVGAEDAVPAEFRLYDTLMQSESAAQDDAEEEEAPVEKDFTDRLNPDSLTILHGYIEPVLKDAAPGERFQFMRQGYFCADLDGKPGAPVFNRTVGLKDSYKG
ncbi:MAG TPA: glutamine--tRNA ligase/YqeY domain fusion protein [Eubacteriales bacterium]|nr:glutamine--tRNA ligase/YqeY domain fusion protein [Eubacteriales bacterium]